MAVTACAFGLLWLVRSSRNPAEAAGLYGFYLAVVTFAFTLLAPMPLSSWWEKGRTATGGSARAEVSGATDDGGERAQVSGAPDGLAGAACWLAEATKHTWRRAADEREIDAPTSLRIIWKWATGFAAPGGDATMPAGQVTGRALPQPGRLLGTGTVTRLHDKVYARLPHGGLVLLGGPGAGKTGAMIQLLLDALKHRAEPGDKDQDREPVPVWLALGGWNPLASPLHDYVEDTMDRDYPDLRRLHGPDVTRKLLDRSRVALFLDGLDEMPEGARPLALKCIDKETPGLRFVLTSRPEEYRGAVKSSRPDNIAVIELLPVTPWAAADYLRHDQTGSHDATEASTGNGSSRQLWDKLGAYLTQHQDSVAARALDNPLTLSLARHAYARQDPNALTRFPTVMDLREHLIEHFLTTAYPGKRQRDRALGWLGWIAYHMGTSQDLQWWDIPGWIPGWKLRLARGMAAGLSMGLGVALAVVAFGQAHSRSAGFYAGLLAGVVAGLVAGLVVRLRPKPVDAPRPDMHPRNPPLAPGLLERRLVRGLLAGVVAGNVFALAASARGADIALSLTSGLAVGVGAALVAGLAFGLGAGLGFGLAGAPQKLVPRWPRPRDLGWIVFPPMLVPVLLNLWATPIADSPSSTAADTYRDDGRTCMIYAFVYGLAFGLLVALGAGLTNGYGQGLAHGPLAAVGWGLVAGLAMWLTAWLVAGQVPLVKLTELILIPQCRDRVRFLRLLEDAHSRQVVRQAGIIYQFRHVELQARLAATRREPARPVTRSAASLLAAGFIITVIPSSIYALQILIYFPDPARWQWLGSVWSYWVILVAAGLGIAITLAGLRKNAVAATVLLWILAWNLAYAATLIGRFSTVRPTLFLALGTQSAIECGEAAAFGAVLCVWMIWLRSRGIREVSPVLIGFTGSMSLALSLAVVAWASQVFGQYQNLHSPAWTGVAVFSIAAALAAVLAAIMVLRVDPGNRPVNGLP